MKKRIMTSVLIVACGAIFIPADTFARTSSAPVTVTAREFDPQVRVQFGTRRNRPYYRNRRYNRDRRWDRGRHRGWNNRNRRTRMTRQVYYVNGRRYVRNVRVRY